MRQLFTTTLVVIVILGSYIFPVTQNKANANLEKAYTYRADFTLDRQLLERKKGKGKKGGKKKPKEEPTVTKDEAPDDDDGPLCNIPPCESPCVIQDPILPDEICNNDCPQGSGCHCEGRHDVSTHVLFAVCAPD